jgi:HEAT repeat protein
VKNPSATYLAILLFLIALSTPPVVFAQAHDAQSQPPPSTAEIIKDLQSPNRLHRERAFKAAMAIKPLPMALVPALLNACRKLSTKNGGDLKAPHGAEPPVCNPGYLVQALLLALVNNDVSVSMAAAGSLIQLAHDSPAVWPAVITALASPQRGIPFVIASGLSNKVGTPIAPLLVRSLSDRNPRIRGGSALALCLLLHRYVTPIGPYTNGEPASALNKYGLTLSGAVLDIAKVLNSIEPDLRAPTIQGLAAIGPPAKGAIPYVLPMFKDDDPGVRWETTHFFGAMGQAGTVAIPDLVERLKDDPVWWVRLAAIGALRGFGPAAKDAVPDLAIALKSTNRQDVEQSSLALANIDPSHEGILPGVMLAINDPMEKQNAFKALNELGIRAKPAVPTLEHLIATDLDSENMNDKAWERHAAVTALAQIEGADAIPKLQKVLSNDRNNEIRIAAVTALGGLGSSNPLALSALVGALNNDSEPVRDAASETLGKLGSAAMPALILALKNGDLYQRAWSVQTLTRRCRACVDARARR